MSVYARRSNKPLTERITHVECFEPFNCIHCKGKGTVPGEHPQYGEIRTCPGCLGQKLVSKQLTIREFRKVLEADAQRQQRREEKNREDR